MDFQGKFADELILIIEIDTAYLSEAYASANSASLNQWYPPLLKNENDADVKICQSSKSAELIEFCDSLGSRYDRVMTRIQPMRVLWSI